MTPEDCRVKARALDALDRKVGVVGRVVPFEETGAKYDLRYFAVDAGEIGCGRKLDRANGDCGHAEPELALCAAADALGLPEMHRVVPVDVAEQVANHAAARARSARATATLYTEGSERPQFAGIRCELPCLAADREREAEFWETALAYLRPTTPPAEREGPSDG